MKEIEFKVDNTTYRIAELLASDRFKLLVEIGNMTGGVMKNMALDDEVNYFKIASSLLNSSTPDAVADFIKRTVQKSVVFPNISKDENYEMHFCDNFDHIIDVISEIISLNYGKSVSRIKKKLFQFGILVEKNSNQQTEKKKHTKN